MTATPTQLAALQSQRDTVKKALDALCLAATNAGVTVTITTTNTAQVNGVPLLVSSIGLQQAL